MPRFRRALPVLLTTLWLLTACATPPPAAPAKSAELAPKPRIPPVIPDLLSSLEGADWQLDRVAQLLPPMEARYQARTEEPDYFEYAYAGGALRLYVSSQGGQVFALLVDPRVSEYSAYAGLSSTDRYLVSLASPYVVVCRVAPVDEATFTTLAARGWSLAELRSQLGEPSHKSHVHGVGSTVYTYLPQGLIFWSNGDDVFKLVDPKDWPKGSSWPLPTFPDYRREYAGRLATFAGSLSSVLAKVKAGLAQGKPSPSGASQAAEVQLGGGYWGDWIIIARPGKAEMRINVDYILDWYDWLDDHRLVYTTMLFSDPFPVYVIDAETGQIKVAAKLPAALGGVAGPGRIWYQYYGVRYQIDLPE